MHCKVLRACRTWNAAQGSSSASNDRESDIDEEQYSLCCHEKNGQDLVDSGETARVNLDGVDRVGLEELLEHHSVVTAARMRPISMKML